MLYTEIRGVVSPPHTYGYNVLMLRRTVGVCSYALYKVTDVGVKLIFQDNREYLPTPSEYIQAVAQHRQLISSLTNRGQCFVHTLLIILVYSVPHAISQFLRQRDKTAPLPGVCARSLIARRVNHSARRHAPVNLSGSTMQSSRRK